MVSDINPRRGTYLLRWPREFQTRVKVVDECGEFFKILFIAGSGADYVVNIAFVEVWFSTAILLKYLFLDMANKQARIVWSKSTSHRDTSDLLVIVAIEAEGIFRVRTSSAMRTRTCVGGC